MTLGDKLRSLRAIEGSLRGLGRPMTQSEVVQAMKQELGRGLSQAYVSQIENGARPHLTNTSRELLARFFRVYPGFLVDDPPGFQTELSAELHPTESSLDHWLLEGAARLCGAHFERVPDGRSLRAALSRPSALQLIEVRTDRRATSSTNASSYSRRVRWFSRSRRSILPSFSRMICFKFSSRTG